MLSSRRTGRALTDVDIHAFAELSIPLSVPFEAAPGSELSRLLSARLHSMAHSSYASLSTSTLRWLAERRGIAMPARYASASTPHEHAALATFLHDAVERAHREDHTQPGSGAGAGAARRGGSSASGGGEGGAGGAGGAGGSPSSGGGSPAAAAAAAAATPSSGSGSGSGGWGGVTKHNWDLFAPPPASAPPTPLPTIGGRGLRAAAGRPSPAGASASPPPSASATPWRAHLAAAGLTEPLSSGRPTSAAMAAVAAASTAAAAAASAAAASAAAATASAAAATAAAPLSPSARAQSPSSGSAASAASTGALVGVGAGTPHPAASPPAPRGGATSPPSPSSSSLLDTPSALAPPASTPALDALRAELRTLSEELRASRELGAAANAECAALRSALAELQARSAEELRLLRDAADMSIAAARESASEDLRLVLEAKAEESLAHRAAAEAWERDSAVRERKAVALLAELNLRAQGAEESEGEILRLRGECGALFGALQGANGALEAEQRRGGAAEAALRADCEARLRGAEEVALGRVAAVGRECAAAEARVAAACAETERVRGAAGEAAASARAAAAAELRVVKEELRCARGAAEEAARVSSESLARLLASPREEVASVQRVLENTLEQLVRARREAGESGAALGRVEAERAALAQRLEAERAASANVRYRCATVEEATRQRFAEAEARERDMRKELETIRGDFELYAPACLDKVGFIMPQSDGRKIPWGPVIEGSVEAWRLAHPRALIANLEGRRDVCDADLAHLSGVLALNIAGCAQLTEGAFAWGGLGAGLRVLDCTGCTRFTSATFARLTGGLRELCCAYCAQEGLGDGAFAGLKGLKAMDMSFCCQRALGNTALAHIGESLMWLNAEGCTQGTLSGTFFSYAPRLQHLSITLQDAAPGAYADAHFAHFEGGPLRSLSLRSVQAAGGRSITDRTFTCSLAGLHTLELSWRGGGGGGPAVTRGAFAALKGRLQRLALHGAVPEVFKDAARAAGLEVRGR